MINAHIDSRYVAQNFAKAHATYRHCAIVQTKMCHTLINMLPPIHPKQVLEIGSGAGNLTDIYAHRWQIETLYLNDLYDTCPTVKAQLLIGDIEALDLPCNLDLVISGSAFQWIKDLPALFGRIYRSLKSGGVLAFSSFGQDNLFQIKELTGIGLDYYGLDELVVMVEMAGFGLMEACEKRQTLYFDHPKDILRHIKQTGVSLSKAQWTRSTLNAFYADYHANFATDKGYPISYHPVFVVAKKP